MYDSRLCATLSTFHDTGKAVIWKGLIINSIYPFHITAFPVSSFFNKGIAFTIFKSSRNIQMHDDCFYEAEKCDVNVSFLKQFVEIFSHLELDVGSIFPNISISLGLVIYIKYGVWLVSHPNMKMMI